MSFSINGGKKMMSVAVNTDPLHHSSMKQERKQSHYGLKLRNISHIKISEINELAARYDIGDKIGEGAFGVVLAVTEKSTSKKFAMKTVVKSNVNRLKLFQREVQILKLIRHPHIIYLDSVYETSKEIYMVFERCYGDFAKIYNDRKPFSEHIAKKVITELVDAVAYLHKYDIVHRDLKMENILIGENPSDPTDEYYIKLSDFGLSVVKSGSGIDSMLHDFCGTLYYMAPEMITLRSYSQQCDIWAVGIILYMLVMGKYPFYSHDEKELQSKICDEEPSFDGDSLSLEVRDLIMSLLMKDPVNRARATEVLQHPWILDSNITKAKQSNILKIMKEWKSEMTVPAGKESDWVAPPPVAQVLDQSNYGKQVMHLPKTNIDFDRSKRGSNSKQKTNDARNATSKRNSNVSNQKFGGTKIGEKHAEVKLK